jgi:hypothetical protein
MGSIVTRNRFWLIRSLYDENMSREFRLSFLAATFLGIPHYVYGIHINRQIEENYSHINYAMVNAPRRNRLTHSMLFEEFEEVLEEWQRLQEQDEQGLLVQ